MQLKHKRQQPEPRVSISLDVLMADTAAEAADLRVEVARLGLGLLDEHEVEVEAQGGHGREAQQVGTIRRRPPVDCGGGRVRVERAGVVPAVVPADDFITDVARVQKEDEDDADTEVEAEVETPEVTG